MPYGTISVDKIENSDGFTLGGSGAAMKNRIINGAMTIDQRNAGASVTVNADAAFFASDRFQAAGQGSDGVYTIQRSATAPAGFANSIVATVTTADSSITASQQYNVQQHIEGLNTADLGFGTANAKTVTLSFWVRSSVTGTFSGAIRNAAADRSYPFSYTINAANTFEQKVVTIPGDQSGTWGVGTGIGLNVIWTLGAGTSRLGPANAWAGANYQGVTGQTNLIATNGATWYLTGVQLEAGSTATSFDYRNYGTELALCQRYFWKQSYTVSNNRYGTGIGIGDATIDGILINLPVPMRTSPTNSVTALGAYDGTNARNVTSLNTNYSTNVLFAQQATADGSFTAGKVIQLYATGSTSFVSSSAEL